MPLDAVPRWSGLGADASGFDVSLVFGSERPEIRVTVEAQAEPASPEAYLAEAVRLTEGLAERHGVELARFRSILPLFERPVPNAAGVLWHGAVFRAGEDPWFKIWFHVRSAGKERDRATAREALGRLDLAASWEAVAAVLTPEDDILFLSLDLVPGDRARVKLYVRHRAAAAGDLDRAARAAGTYRAGDALPFVDLVAGPGAVLRRGALTCYHLEGGRSRPVHVSTHLRLYPHCARFDGEIAARVRRALEAYGLDTALYDAALGTLAAGPLDLEEGIHGWASFQRSGERPRVSVYFSPRMYLARHGPIALDPPRLWPSPL